MLVPAVLWKDEIQKEFSMLMYDEDTFYYQGYSYGHCFSDIKPMDNIFQYAIVGGNYEVQKVHHQEKSSNGHGSYYVKRERVRTGDKLIGYFSYQIIPGTDTVHNFGLYSFDKGNMLLARDVFNKMEELANDHLRVEWRCVEGNPACSGYLKFCLRMRNKGYWVFDSNMLHMCTRDNRGKYHDEYTFEIINPKKAGKVL